MAKLHDLLLLPPTLRHLLLQAAFCLTALRLAAVLLPFKAQTRLQTRLTRTSRQRLASPDEVAPPVVWAVETASRYLPGSTCYLQALTGKILLARAGCPAQIQVGVRKDEQGRVQAHAWLVSQGEVIIGGVAPGFYTAFPDNLGWASENLQRPLQG